MENQLANVIYHLGKFVTDNQNCVLEVLMDKDVALVHLIPVEIYDGLEDLDDDCE